MSVNSWSFFPHSFRENEVVWQEAERIPQGLHGRHYEITELQIYRI